MEARHLKTWIHDDEAQMARCLLELQDRDPLIAHQLHKIQVYKVQVNNVHRRLIACLEQSPGWTGPQTIGTHKGIIHVGATEESVSEQDGQGEEIELGSDGGSSEGASEDDSAQGPGAILVVWNAIGDDSATLDHNE